MSTTPIISFDRATFAYPHGEEVFREASFTIPKGSFHLITGPSGAGKTTLLKLIYSANRSYLGSIKVFGQEMKQMNKSYLPEFRRQFGIVFQEFNLFNHLTPIDNVALPLTLAGEPLEHAREKAASMLSWLGLGSYLEKDPTLLSGGQRQRIAIARATVCEPQVILADEPSGHVDSKATERLMSLFEKLNSQGKTIIMATHNSDLINNSGYPRVHIEDREVFFKNKTINANKNTSTKKASTKKTSAKRKTITKTVGNTATERASNG